ncbi:Lipid droplet phospholipase 1-like protein [Drosera capensis]
MEKGTMLENGVCCVKEESVNGGSYDVWRCQKGLSSSADHLVVMVHGILGSANDWKFAAEQFVRLLLDKVFVRCSENNAAKTLDGVDVMGDRLVEEILEVIKRQPGLRKISFVAHSVGGLVARYAIGKLYQSPSHSNSNDLFANGSLERQRGTIGGLEAINFITVATPHLGSRGNKQVPFLFGSIALEKLATRVIHLIFRRTGRHLFLTDNDEGKPPLLRRMVQDQSEYPFMSALRAFRRRVAYANVGYDHIVGWRTSSFRCASELPKWEDALDEKYPHIVYEEHCKARDAEQHELSSDAESVADWSSDKIEEELARGLSRVSWNKVDVSFHTSRLRFAAHSVIQADRHPQDHSQKLGNVSHTELLTVLAPLACNPAYHVTRPPQPRASTSPASPSTPPVTCPI